MSPDNVNPDNVNPDTVSDVDAITALVHEYAFRLDGGDLDGVAALFANAVVSSTRTDRIRRGTAEVREMYEPVILGTDGTPGTMHQITNVTVTVERPEARARSYFTVLQVIRLGLHPILVGEYRDRFALVDGRWHFTERIIDPRLFGDLGEHMRA